MEIQVSRGLRGVNTTLSPLTINGKDQCFILEDIDRGLKQHMSAKEIVRIKMPKVTAIPTGRYQVLITWSPTFKRFLPLIVDVPGFAGIRIHSGNRHQDTEGCLITGKAYQKEGGDYVIKGGTSRPAFDELNSKIQAAIKAGDKVFITITSQYETGN